MARSQVLVRRWFAGDTAKMAGVTVLDIRNYRSRSKDWPNGGDIFDRADDEGWQRFALPQVGAIGVLGEAGRSGIPLEIASTVAGNAGLSVAFWALAIEAKTDRNIAESDGRSGTWSQRSRWLIAINPTAQHRDVFFGSANPEEFPSWAKKLSPSSFSAIDLRAIAQRIVDNTPTKSADGIPGGLADVVITR